MPTIPSTADILTAAASSAQPVYNSLQPVQNLYLGVGFAIVFFLLIVGVGAYFIGHARMNH
jgi:hypothetical protein